MQICQVTQTLAPTIELLIKKTFILTLKFVPIFQTLKIFYILVTVIVTNMANNISKKNIAENPTEVSLKTPSDFQSLSNCQEIQSSTEFDESKMRACRKFYNKTG